MELAIKEGWFSLLLLLWLPLGKLHNFFFETPVCHCHARRRWA